MKCRILLTLCMLIDLILLIPFPYAEVYISERAVLTVDTIEITEYELEKRMDTKLPADRLISYIDNFIDRAYILAEASRRGYMEDPEINKTVEKMSKIIVTQAFNGLLYEEVINKNISISDPDLKETYKKFNKPFNVEYLRFPDYAVMVEIVGCDSLMTDEETFHRYVKKCEAIPEVRYEENIIAWPFVNFIMYRDYLYSMKEHQITSPLSTYRGVFIMLVTRIEERKHIPPFEEKKEMLRKMLEIAEQHKGMFLYDEKLLAAAGTKIYDNNAEKIFSRLDYEENSYLIDKNKFSDILDELVLSFSLDGNFIEITVDDFIDRYNGQLIISKIENRIKLYNFLKDWVIVECGYLEAEKLGITQTKKFVLDRKNFKYDTIYNLFIRDELLKNINIAEREIEQAYHDRIDSFEDGTQVNLSVFRFNSRENAFIEYIELKKQINEDIQCEIDVPDTARGLIGKELELSVSHDSDAFPPGVMQSLFRADESVLMSPVDMDDHIAVIYKHSESGNRVKPLDDVRTELTEQLRQEKFEIIKKELIEDLKKKYTIKNNINYDKYLN